MRINKYRAWVKSEKRYIVDTQDFIPLIVTNKGVMKLQPQFEKHYYEILPLDWFIIEQFTGLHDKNGVEIYEGDIIEVKSINGKEHFKTEVLWDNDVCGFGFQCSSIDGNMDFMDSLPHNRKTYISHYDYCEVTGNIHERSEDNDN